MRRRTGTTRGRPPSRTGRGRRARLDRLARLGAGLLAAASATPCAAAEPAFTDDGVHTVLFGSLDAGSANFLAAGAKLAEGRTEREGWAALGSLGYGARFERDRAAPETAFGLRAPLAVRHTALASLVGGYQWFFDWGVVALYAGPEMSYEVFAAPSQQRWPRPRFGGRVHGEVWARPSEETLVTATLIAGSARGDLWTRLSWGTRALTAGIPWLEGAYLGPEAALYADDRSYRKWSLGLHATGVALGDVSLRLSLGGLYEEQIRRPGGYVALSAWTAL